MAAESLINEVQRTHNAAEDDILYLEGIVQPPIPRVVLRQFSARWPDVATFVLRGEVRHYQMTWHNETPDKIKNQREMTRRDKWPT